MEEIKGILLDMQKNMKKLEQNQEEMKEQFSKQLKEEVHKVNQRLAVFQEDITQKVNILLDADIARQEILEIHDLEIREIRNEQFKHSIEIKNLKKKVVGA